LGIDIGGTFTDIVVYDHHNHVFHKFKELTTPADPVQGTVSGIRRLLQKSAIFAAEFSRVVHATTLFTNALVERKGADTGLITTEGFRDTLEIRNERKYDMYDVFIEMPKPLIPRSLRLEVPERIDVHGSIIKPLDQRTLLQCADHLVEKGIDSIAIVFLNAFAKPIHEDQAARLIKERYPNVSVSVSHEVACEIREYERTSTTVVNAYVKPLAERYLGNLTGALEDLGIHAPIFLMLSNGGLTHVEEAKARPVQMLESGPAAGALAAAFFAQRSRMNTVIAFDMGGTTAKLSVVENGQPLVTYSFEAAREQRFIAESGSPIKISAIELIEIGAGGGSIANIDPLGLLKVGPESSGADPGPACYERGGTEPTVTDVNLLLGYLDPAYFAGGSFSISRSAAEISIRRLKENTGLSSVEVSWGAHDIVNENMAAAARVHIAERGKDPRRHALVVTGGGGPLHGTQLAKKLGIKEIICPPAAGVASALGLLLAPVRVDRVATVAKKLDRIVWDTLEGIFRSMEEDAKGVIRQTGLDPTSATVRRLADMRYVGQGFEIVVNLPEGPYKENTKDAFVRAFEKTYQEIFSQTLAWMPIEIINARISVSAQSSDIDLDWKQGVEAAPEKHVLKNHRSVYFPDKDAFIETPVYDRFGLEIGTVFKGPAVIEEPESTLIIGPDDTFFVESSGNLRVNIGKVKTKQSKTRFDSATLEVMWRRLIATMDEASAALIRSAFSTVLRESDDFSVVLTDDCGRLLAQATRSIPVFIGSLPRTVQHFLKAVPPEQLSPGDILITNDPWMGTGHLADINLAKPIFYNDTLVGFSASTAHAPDIGGRSGAQKINDVFEEGFQIPIMKLMAAGRMDESIIKLLRANVRAPDEVIGDLWAQITALNTVEKHVHTLMAEWRLTALTDFAQEIQGRCEQAMRTAIREIPDGCYRYSLQTDGMDEPIRLETTVTVSGDHINIDYTGSSPQVRGAINVAMCYTFAFTAYAVKCLLSPQIPNNEGSFRPVTVSAPKGVIVNQTFPFSGGNRALVGHYLPFVVFGAMAPILPDRVMAGAGSPIWSMLLTGRFADGKPFAQKCFFNGGLGATHRNDGLSVLSWPSNISGAPVEMVEQLVPVRIHGKRLRPDSGGAGKFRGGLGQEMIFEVLSDTSVTVGFNAERTRNPAPGLFGGSEGAPGEILINRAPIDIRSQYMLKKGDEITIRTPGGGGYGRPAERNPIAIENDLNEGYITENRLDRIGGNRYPV
jgi:N-methylhydantoinase A/oxoprolinase/acetone carboxylase beta subunit/N-methylhydantoinase B/oxoprolinase/acetone carboxylase alpha subunit